MGDRNSSQNNQAVVVRGRAGPSNPILGVIANRYEVRNEIGSGSYGSVHYGKDRLTGHTVAIKITRTQSGIFALTHEANIYVTIRSLCPTYRGFARLCYSEVTPDPTAVLILEMLGRPVSFVLLEYIQRNGRHFSNTRIMKIGIQVVQHIRVFHSVGYMHEDIKPDNILVGKHNDNRMHLVDFGLSKKIFGRDGNHNRYPRDTGATITIFSSRARVFGSPPGRRDDLECLGFCFLYLKTGQLPWSDGARGKTGARLLEYLRWVHRRTSTRQLCEGFGSHLANYFTHLRNLEFSAAPNYDYLINCLEAMKAA